LTLLHVIHALETVHSLGPSYATGFTPIAENGFETRPYERHEP